MILSKIFLGYLVLVDKTSNITYKNIELLKGQNVVGFWHEDSFLSQLILKQLVPINQKATVLVTGKWRGDVIAEIIEHYKGEPFRVTYEGKTVEQFKQLFQQVKTSKNLIVMAFDGPKGPRHEIKKVAFLLSCKNKRRLVGVKIRYKRKIQIRHRWDKYVIPLPFNKISVEIVDIGMITASDLRDMKEKNEYIVHMLND